VRKPAPGGAGLGSVSDWGAKPPRPTRNRTENPSGPRSTSAVLRAVFGAVYRSADLLMVASCFGANDPNFFSQTQKRSRRRTHTTSPPQRDRHAHNTDQSLLTSTGAPCRGLHCRTMKALGPSITRRSSSFGMCLDPRLPGGMQPSTTTRSSLPYGKGCVRYKRELALAMRAQLGNPHHTMT
jgi:hypothetical protein